MSTLAPVADSIPREESDPGAVAWVAARLSPAQIRALQAFDNDERRDDTAKGLGVSGTTLMSLNDFRRGERGCMAPLMLTAWDRDSFDGRRVWGRLEFGVQVLAALSTPPRVGEG